MDQAVKEQWVAALRSGKYKQGSGVLRDDAERFCCLGVLCDLLDPEGWSPPVLNDDPDEDGPDDHAYGWHDQRNAELPDVDEVGLDFKTVLVTIGVLRDTLFNLNDRGTPFEQIAEAIEAQL